MQTIVSQLDAAFRSAISAAFGIDADPLLGASQNEKFADYQSNAAMGLAKVLSEKTGQKTNPRAVAEQIKAKLAELDLLGEMAQEVSIAGPGFINIRLAPAWLAKQLGAIAADPRLGIETAASPQRVVVDYSGPNVAKQMHVGHLRSTIIGDAISRVIEFQGHDVIRQNHIGDWGTQFGMLIAYLRAQGQEESRHIEDLESFYKEAKKKFDEDAAFQDEARKTVVRLQGGQPEELALWKRIVDESRRHFEPIYKRLGVKLAAENQRGESFYNPMLRKVVDDLKQKGLAVESEGAVAIFVEGFENPLIIEKSGGGFLYGTTDLAAIRYRVEKLHAQRIIYTHDSRQAQHFAQVFDTARRAGWANGVQLDYAPFGTMLGEDGKPFKARSGETVRLKDVLDEAERRALVIVLEKNPEFPESQRGQIAHSVGIGAVKYADLSKDRNSDYVFSWDKMLTFEGNTAPYMQYAHARIASIFRKAAGTGAIAPNLVPQLESPFEQSLAKHVLRFQEVIGLVSRELKPHHLSAYLYDLAGKFSSFYENCEVLKSEEPTRSSRLLLIDITRRTLATGLELLGIEHPDQM
ncbi:MAG TPA: arginine--tRNA ligase [Tepidisphaeraceae bacterium]|jgi:arginyl-tRNA synthetase|nr:arginine--tRNA ligase [Tepidisphaeraceae bacterium]